MNLRLVTVFLILLSKVALAQDLQYARFLVDTLAAPGMHGRGYVNNGDKIAAGFLAGECGRLGLLPFTSGYQQKFTFPMNTFPGKMEVAVNSAVLKPGSDFQVWAAAPDLKGTFEIVFLTPEILLKPRKLSKFLSHGYSEKFVLIDKQGVNDKNTLRLLDSLKYYNFLHAKGLIYVNDSKLVWSVVIGSRVRSYPVIDIKREVLPENIKTITVDIESEFVPKHPASNVYGWIKGKVESDTFLVFTAHYDHLGRMGSSVYYPGANDNGSGTAMVMDMARHYSQAGNQPFYSMAFVFLSGEEAGLLGAQYCADHPPVDLKKIKFLVNLDMVGTGSEGITMVNANRFKGEFDRMVKINADNEYILTVKERGESCNSDHCPFYEKGVPSVFIYSLGKEYSEYHNPYDQSSRIPFSEYNDIFRLMSDFMNGFSVPVSSVSGD